MSLAVQAHVYFWALPLGEVFTHQGKTYTKRGTEEAEDPQGTRWVFEAHHGALIPAARAEALKLGPGAFRSDR